MGVNESAFTGVP